jgi:hypothetical protein
MARPSASVFTALARPETVTPKPGALVASPHVSVPARARRALVPSTLPSWALGGFYFSLMPSLVRIATGVTLPIVGGLVVSVLTFSGAMAVLSLRNASAGISCSAASRRSSRAW